MLLYFKHCSCDVNTKPRKAGGRGRKRRKERENNATGTNSRNESKLGAACEQPVQNYNSQRSRGGKSGSNPAESLLPEVTRDPQLVPAPGDSPAPLTAR